MHCIYRMFYESLYYIKLVGVTETLLSHHFKIVNSHGTFRIHYKYRYFRSKKI